MAKMPDIRIVGPFEWVERTQTCDAVDDPALQAIENNPGWKLIGVGVGNDGQTTLTFGWPWPQEEKANADRNT